jgi:hypothetical protein
MVSPFQVMQWTIVIQFGRMESDNRFTGNMEEGSRNFAGNGSSYASRWAWQAPEVRRLWDALALEYGEL